MKSHARRDIFAERAMDVVGQMLTGLVLIFLDMLTVFLLSLLAVAILLLKLVVSLVQLVWFLFELAKRLISIDEQSCPSDSPRLQTLEA